MHASKFFIMFCLFVLMGNVGCTTVKKYQMVYQNDYLMQPNILGIEKFEAEAILFREGASGGDGGHTGGGCGCN